VAGDRARCLPSTLFLAVAQPTLFPISDCSKPGLALSMAANERDTRPVSLLGRRPARAVSLSRLVEARSAGCRVRTQESSTISQSRLVDGQAADYRCGFANGCAARTGSVILALSRCDGNATRIAMSLSRGRGHIRTDRGRALVVARCPLCGEEHRYDKGAAGGEEIESLRNVGYTDEWLPCQMDLPGNFWRIVIVGGRQGPKLEAPRRARRSKGK
jgi:hypothetical protein